MLPSPLSTTAAAPCGKSPQPTCVRACVRACVCSRAYHQTTKDHTDIHHAVVSEARSRTCALGTGKLFVNNARCVRHLHGHNVESVALPTYVPCAASPHSGPFFRCGQRLRLSHVPAHHTKPHHTTPHKLHMTVPPRGQAVHSNIDEESDNNA